MHIVRLTLKNFGSFQDISIDFPSLGVSLISGENGAGKSQLMGAIVAAIVGKRAIHIYPHGEGPSIVSLVI
jgi:DNA repair exonuclease SbcCD ATPase subunit